MAHPRFNVLAKFIGLLAVSVTLTGTGYFFGLKEELQRREQIMALANSTERMETLAYLFSIHQCIVHQKEDQALYSVRHLMQKNRDELLSKADSATGVASLREATLEMAEPILYTHRAALPESKFPFKYTTLPEFHSDSASAIAYPPPFEPAPVQTGQPPRRIQIPPPTGGTAQR